MSNRLKNEQSKYLLQHAYNPVDWHPWGEEAFALAKNHNKPLLVSIGYAACHWCHVMERESFEDETVAAFMNANFVCIKVDREEHPDVDHFYMDAVQAIGGSGGWPLNVFVTGDKLPFYGGTYFPPREGYGKPSWMQLLQHIVQLWTERMNDVEGQALQLKKHLQQLNFKGNSKQEIDFTPSQCQSIADNMLLHADKEWGGFGRAPKFPSSMAIIYLLEVHSFWGHEAALQQALLSLDKMAAGGIYDHLGGGFARYSTDTRWLAPHFEKMLYDNALLVSAYSCAYRIKPNENYKQIITQTLAFVQRELCLAEGGYNSALDADSEGVEGKFYTWTWNEWKGFTGKGYEAVTAYFGIVEKGNWEGTNILHTPQTKSAIAMQFGISENELEKQLEDVKIKLFDAREKRERPITDDKCLLSWNALLNIAYLDAAQALEEEAYLKEARKQMEWMLRTYIGAENCLHTYKEGKARIPAKLDDLAYLIKALIKLAESLKEPRYLIEAKRLTVKVLEDFLHEDGTMLYFTGFKQNDIPIRKVDIYDGATPSANAVMAGNLMMLGICFGNTEWIEQSKKMMQSVSGMALQYGTSFACWSAVILHQTLKPKIVICSGVGAAEKSEALLRNHLPHCLVLTLEKEIYDIPILENKYKTGEKVIFVCTEETCLQPESETGIVLQHLVD